MNKTIKHLLMLCLFGMISIAASAIPNNTIYYTSSDGNVVGPDKRNAFGGATIVSNEYSNGQGIIAFDRDVTSIGERAFFYCSGLTSVTIPNSVTSIGIQAFYVCKGLTSVTIPNSVTSIGSQAFDGCSGLTSVTIPNSVTEIGSDAFHNCSGLTSVTIPNSVTSIDYGTFKSCSSLTSVAIGNSVTEIRDYAFEGCDNVKELIYAEGTKTVLRTYLTSITSVTIPNSVTSIGWGAFSGCKGLKSVTIPNSVTSIGGWAFYNCSGLTSVAIGKSVTSIGENPFMCCSGLTSIAVEGGNMVYDSRDNCNAIIETASNTLITGCKNTTIPNSVTSIGDYAFYECSGLTSVTIPNSVTLIGDYAFRDCSGLTSVTIGNSVTEIGNYAFYYCSGLTSVTIGNSVTEIGNYAFYKCSGLTSVTIPNSVTSIGSSAFYGCSGLKSITVNWSRPLSITDNVFSGVDYDNCVLYVPKGTSMLYMVAPEWINFKNIQEFDTPDPVYKQLSITSNKYGKVLYNGKEITGTTWNGKVEQGENLTFTIVPNPGCYLQKVTMNGMNVTKYIVDNVFTIEGVESDVTLNVTFEQEEVSLIVKTSEGVEKEIAVEPGQQFTFNLSAYIDNIASVTFNGKDVTADIETKSESIPVWQLANNDIDKCSYQLYTTPAITESSELIITYKVNHPKGDTNEDGTVDVADITATASIILTGKAKEEEDLEE